MTKIELIDKLYKLSPYTIEEHELGGRLGEFYPNKNNSIVIINKSISSVDKKIEVLTHEIGHALCYKNKCKCFNPYLKKLCEFHAIMFSLSFLYKCKALDSLHICIRFIITHSNYYTNNEYYTLAAQCIINTDLWKKCIQLVYKQEQLLLF